MKLTKDNEILIISSFEIQDDIVVLTWGQYTRVMSEEEFNLYTQE